MWEDLEMPAQASIKNKAQVFQTQIQILTEFILTQILIFLLLVAQINIWST